MSEFTRPIDLRYSDYARPTTCNPIEGWRYFLDWEDGKEYAEVTSDLVTDGLSGPSKIRGIFPQYEIRTLKAAITHDSLYHTPVIHIITDTAIRTRPCSRKEADKIFLDCIKITGAKWVEAADNKWIHLYRRHSWNARCILAYVALRLCGWVAWYKHRFNDWRA